jgi:hypothetical protein
VLLIATLSFITVAKNGKVTANKGTWENVNVGIVAGATILAVSFGVMGAYGNTFVGRHVGQVADVGNFAAAILVEKEVLADGDFPGVVVEFAAVHAAGTCRHG